MPRSWWQPGASTLALVAATFTIHGFPVASCGKDGCGIRCVIGTDVSAGMVSGGILHQG